MIQPVPLMDAVLILSMAAVEDNYDKARPAHIKLD